MKLKKNIGIAGLFTGISISFLMQSFITTSLPVIVKELQGLSLYNWVIGGYLLSSTVTIPLFGKLSDILGRKLLYLGGVVIFATGLCSCGFAPTMFWLILSRIVMGIGAGAIVPSALAALGDLFNEQEIGKVFGAVGIIQVISNVTGPLLGGFITDALSWRWLFFLLFPGCLLCGVLVLVGLPSVRNKNKISSGRIDWQGSVLIMLALSALLLGCQLIKQEVMSAGIILAVVAVPLLLLFLKQESRHPDPVIPVKMIISKKMHFLLLGTFLLGIVFNGTTTYIPLLIENIYKSDAMDIGIHLVPLMVAAGIGSGMSSRILSRNIGSKTIFIWGGICLAFIWLVLHIFTGIPMFLPLILVLIGFGMGSLLPVFFFLAQQQGGEEHRGMASGLIQLSRNFGGAIGVTLLGLWVTDKGSVFNALGFIFGIQGVSAFIAIFIMNKLFCRPNKVMENNFKKHEEK